MYSKLGIFSQKVSLDLKALHAKIHKNIKARKKQDGGVWLDSDPVIITGDFAFDLIDLIFWQRCCP